MDKYTVAAKRVIDLVGKMITTRPAHVMLGSYPLMDSRDSDYLEKEYDRIVADIAACIRDAMADADGQPQA
jgi:hypothetical protein